MLRVITVVEKEGSPWPDMLFVLQASAATELERINGRIICSVNHPTVLAVIADSHVTQRNVEAWMIEPEIDEYSAQGLDSDEFTDRIGVTRSASFTARPFGAEFDEDFLDDPDNPHGLHFFYLLVDDRGFSDDYIIERAVSADRHLDSEDKLLTELRNRLCLAAS